MTTADEPDEPVEEEPKELTLDEYRAMQSALRPSSGKPQFNIRKAGEGCDDKQWKKTYVLAKKKIDDDESDEDESEVSGSQRDEIYGVRRTCIAETLLRL